MPRAKSVPRPRIVDGAKPLTATERARLVSHAGLRMPQDRVGIGRLLEAVERVRSDYNDLVAWLDQAPKQANLTVDIKEISDAVTALSSLVAQKRLHPKTEMFLDAKGADIQSLREQLARLRTATQRSRLEPIQESRGRPKHSALRETIASLGHVFATCPANEEDSAAEDFAEFVRYALAGVVKLPADEKLATYLRSNRKGT